MDILKIPNKILTSHAEDVKDFSGMESLSLDMISTAIQADLIGLSGNQVGLLKRVFVINMAQGEETPNYRTFINPKTKVNQAMGKSFAWEGCGSIPNINALVERWQGLTITAQDITGEIFTMKLTGLLARCAMHEIDHLNGVLMTSKARQLKRI